jgi:uncharacterized protein (DUF2147 family)
VLNNTRLGIILLTNYAAKIEEGMIMIKNFSAAFVLTCVTMTAHATDLIGFWTTIDDETGKARSVVEIYKEEGKLSGKVVEVIGETENDICTKCNGELKNHPIVGLRFMWGLEKDGNGWDDGKILDPNNGEIYSSKLEISEDGNILDVRGYVGFAAFGRSQTWHRKVASVNEATKESAVVEEVVPVETP